MRALVVDECGLRGAVVGIRGLAEAGWRVGLATACPRGVAAASRHVSARHPLPRVAEQPEAFVHELAAIAGGYDVLLPAGDAEAMAVSEHRDRFAATAPYPDHPAVVATLDKIELAAAARAVGVATPAEIAPGDVGDRPVIIKQRWAEGDGAARWETVRTRGADRVAEHVGRMRQAGLEPLLQEVVEGDLLALSVVLDRDGEVVAAVQSLGEPQTWPPVTGMRVRSRTVAVDRDLLERVVAMLRRQGWWGIADVDFIQPPGGAPRLIDCNGRFFGSMALARAAGINLPDLWARVATGRPVPAPTFGRAGVPYQWLEGDLRLALRSPRRWSALAEVARAARGAAHSTTSLRDPAPVLVRGATLVRNRLR